MEHFPFCKGNAKRIFYKKIEKPVRFSKLHQLYKNGENHDKLVNSLKNVCIMPIFKGFSLVSVIN